MEQNMSWFDFGPVGTTEKKLRPVFSCFRRSKKMLKMSVEKF